MGSHLHLFHVCWGIGESGWRAGSNMYMVGLTYFDQASSVPQLIRPTINVSLCMVLDPRSVNWNCQFTVELPLVLSVGICGRAGRCHLEQLQAGGSEVEPECLHLLCLPTPANTCPYLPCLTTLAYTCPYLPTPAVPAHSCHVCLHLLTLAIPIHSQEGPHTRMEVQGLMWPLRLTHKVQLISIENVIKISRSF